MSVVTQVGAHSCATRGAARALAVVAHAEVGQLAGSVPSGQTNMRMHMKSRIVRAAWVAVLAAIVICGDATAWGTRAQQSITLMSMQVVKQQFPGAFKAGATSYEKDCLAGASAGVAALSGKVPLNTDAETIQAIGTEIQLLREVREYGMGSYFAYRMGVLSALVANVMTPYGFAFGPNDDVLQQKVFADIESAIGSYNYSPIQKNREIVRDPRTYFRNKRPFINDDRRLIAEDYQRGRGYNGFLKEGGPAYFVRCVEAVADVWASVLTQNEEPSLAAASRRMQTWYFVDEIDYLLQEKKNPQVAERAYENFRKVVQENEPETYERIGDSFASFGGEEGTDRAVREWQNAHGMAGENRASVAAKLNRHYLAVGNKFLDIAAKPGADDNDLPSALRAFESALEFDRKSEDAADLIQKTHVLINERNARRDTTLKILASAEKLTTQADALTQNEDFGGAIKTYRQAMSFYASVGDEFKDEAKKGKQGVRDVKSAINKTIQKIISRGSEVIDAGEKAEEEKRFEEAIAQYSKVEAIVSVIPDENITGNKSHATQKADMIQLAKTKIDDAKKAKLRYEEQQKAAEAAAKKGGRKTGTTPPPAPAQ